MKALLVIDVQNGVYVDGGVSVFAGERVVGKINGLIGAARLAKCPIVFIQHQNEALVHGSDAWDLLSALDVRTGDIFVEKRHGSAFHETALAERLRSSGIGQVVLCGMQTEFCVDSTFRHAFALGFEVELAKDAHTTFDSEPVSASQIVDHHNRTLRGYGDILPAESVVFAGSKD